MRSVLLVLLVACGSPPPPELPKNAGVDSVPAHPCAKLLSGERDVIYGRLTDTMTHEPVVGSTIVVEEDLPESDTLRQQYEPGLTDADGCYAFVVKRTGRLTVIAYYADLTKRVTVDRSPNGPTAVDLEMSIDVPPMESVESKP
jgi:hypothetical protein